MTSDPMMLLSQARLRELQDDARRQALVRLATCCRPSALRAALTRLAQRRPALDVCCA